MNNPGLFSDVAQNGSIKNNVSSILTICLIQYYYAEKN